MSTHLTSLESIIVSIADVAQRGELAGLYALAIGTIPAADTVAWQRINGAILHGADMAYLERIKRRAWKLSEVMAEALTRSLNPVDGT